MFCFGWLAFLEVDRSFGVQIDFSRKDLMPIWIGYFIIVSAIYTYFTNTDTKQNTKLRYGTLGVILIIALYGEYTMVRTHHDIGSDLIIAISMFFIGSFFSYAIGHRKNTGNNL